MAINIGRQLLPASTIEGTAVQNAAGEDLGEINELMIDLEKGRIAYAVLSFGGFLGLGDKLFALPWEALNISPEGDVFILNVRRTFFKCCIELVCISLMMFCMVYLHSSCINMRF